MIEQVRGLQGTIASGTWADEHGQVGFKLGDVVFVAIFYPSTIEPGLHALEGAVLAELVDAEHSVTISFTNGARVTVKKRPPDDCGPEVMAITFPEIIVVLQP